MFIDSIGKRIKEEGYSNMAAVKSPLKKLASFILEYTGHRQCWGLIGDSKKDNIF